MKAVISSDHAGFKLKEAIKPFLQSKGYSVTDLGATSEDPVDYPDFAKRVGRAVSEKTADIGVLICGSGIGVCMTANRFKNVRAVVINSEFDAEMSRKHNDANVACFGARRITEEAAKKLLGMWLATSFEGGRHEKRVRKIEI